jgi:hypothetical protein
MKLIRAVAKSELASADDRIDREPRKSWTTLWTRPFSSEQQIGQMDRVAVFREMDDAWQAFVDNDLRRIKSVVAEAFGKE